MVAAPSTADRVTTILHPFYEAYLLKLFSHSHLLLYTEDSVVLKSVLIRSRGGVVTRGSIVSPSYHTGHYHLSLYIHYLCISYHELCSHRISCPSIIVVLELGPQAGRFVLNTIVMITRV